MIVAKKKRKSNIAEYILYMWQVEDMIRALDFDVERINEKLVAQYDASEEQKGEILAWYKNLALMLQKEQKAKQGHAQFLVNLVDDMNDLHLALIKEGSDREYIDFYNKIEQDISHVRQKSQQKHHDIEVALNALYIILMLKMRNKDVSEGTQEAVFKFGNFLGLLSKRYKDWESGDLEISI